MAIGRKAYTEGLGLDKAGIDTDDRGRIEVDEFFETTLEGIYAIGDVIKGQCWHTKLKTKALF